MKSRSREKASQTSYANPTPNEEMLFYSQHIRPQPLLTEIRIRADQPCGMGVPLKALCTLNQKLFWEDFVDFWR